MDKWGSFWKRQRKFGEKEESEQKVEIYNEKTDNVG